MVPIRTVSPVGAIGNYWATQHEATPEEVKLLQSLADTTAVAMENVQILQELEARIAQRTTDLQESNKELRASLDKMMNPDALVRMCAWTRRLEFDGQWLDIETFLHRRFGIQVTHGISQDAMRMFQTAQEEQKNPP
jgi:hypothetical protein